MNFCYIYIYIGSILFFSCVLYKILGCVKLLFECAFVYSCFDITSGF